MLDRPFPTARTLVTGNVATLLSQAKYNRLVVALLSLMSASRWQNDHLCDKNKAKMPRSMAQLTLLENLIAPSWNFYACRTLIRVVDISQQNFKMARSAMYLLCDRQVAMVCRGVTRYFFIWVRRIFKKMVVELIKTISLLPPLTLISGLFSQDENPKSI